MLPAGGQRLRSAAPVFCALWRLNVGTTSRRSVSVVIATEELATSDLATKELVTTNLLGTDLAPKELAPRTSWANASADGERPLFDTILNNMSHGVLMFDQSAKLIFCNRRYGEMYGLPPDVVQPGATLRELLEHRRAAGSFSGDGDQYVGDLLDVISKGKATSDIVRLTDGRVISLVNKPIAGIGWLATHEDVTERTLAEEQIAHMARHDALTDLPNRMMLRERLEHELKRVKRGECLAVLCLDLDHFKGVNDTLGHPIGDELLKVVAERLRGCTREPDTIARLGGDEFAIIMTAMQQPNDAAALCRRVREAIAKPFNLDGHQVIVDISIGISVAPLDG